MQTQHGCTFNNNIEAVWILSSRFDRAASIKHISSSDSRRSVVAVVAIVAIVAVVVVIAVVAAVAVRTVVTVTAIEAFWIPLSRFH